MALKHRKAILKLFLITRVDILAHLAEHGLGDDQLPNEVDQFVNLFSAYPDTGSFGNNLSFFGLPGTSRLRLLRLFLGGLFFFPGLFLC